MRGAARDRLFKFARQHGWPLSICWLLAPTPFQRSSVVLSMHFKRHIGPSVRPLTRKTWDEEIVSGSRYTGDDDAEEAAQ